jgi:hypothetical protein
MTTAAVVVLFLLVLAAVLVCLRGFGAGYRTWDLGWIGLGILIVLGIFLTLTGVITF